MWEKSHLNGLIQWNIDTNNRIHSNWMSPPTCAENPLRLSWISEISRQILSTLSCQLLRGFRWHTHISIILIYPFRIYYFMILFTYCSLVFSERFRTFIHISWKYWNVRFPPFKLWNKFSSLMVYHAEKWWARSVFRFTRHVVRIWSSFSLIIINGIKCQ